MEPHLRVRKVLEPGYRTYVHVAVLSLVLALVLGSAPLQAADAPMYCGLARTVDGFDYVEATNMPCASALGATVSIEHGVRGPWSCSRQVETKVELSCISTGRRIDLLERSPVAAKRAGSFVVLSNWTFRLRGDVVLGKPTSRKLWQTLAVGRWCIPDVPREVLIAFRLKPVTPNGGCFRST